MRIAVLQRDPITRESIKNILTDAQHSCTTYDDGLSILNALSRSTVDLLILDWQGGRIAGIEVLKSVRVVSGNRVPVMFVSADFVEESVIGAFAAGADDYVPLPLRPGEFEQRVKALLCRAYPDRSEARRPDVGPYQFDMDLHTVMLHGQLVQLSVTQYKLACLFFSNIGRLMSRDHIFAMIWGKEFHRFTRTIDSHVSRLRALLEIEPRNGFRLQPVYNSGYRLVRVRQDETDIAKQAA